MKQWCKWSYFAILAAGAWSLDAPHVQANPTRRHPTTGCAD